jgi:hypothetical protein
MLPASNNKHTSYADADIVISALSGSLQNDTAGRPMSLSYAIQGSTPNRKLVVQWSNTSIRYMSAATDDYIYTGPFNFQIHVEESTGDISMVYDEFPQLPTNLSSKFSVGIRGCDFLDNLSLQMSTKLGWEKPKVLLAHENNPLTIVSQTSKPSAGMTYTWTTKQVTGIDDATGNGQDVARVSPNPGSSVVSIQAPYSIARVQLYDVTGTCVIDKSTSPDTKVDVNVMNIDNGRYVAHVTSTTGMVLSIGVTIVH